MNVLRLGVVDALSPRCVTIIRSNARIRSKLRKTWLLNCGIFIGSMLLFNWAMMPFLSLLFPQNSMLTAAFQLLYSLLWLYPVYVVSLILNSRWYSRIAEEAMILRAQEIAHRKLNSRDRNLAKHFQLPSKQPILQSLAGEMYRLVFGLVYLAQSALVTKLPFVGSIAIVICLSFISSLYCFEYVWSLLGLSQQQRLDYFAKHWLYMLGYGIPLALNAVLSPPLLRDGIFALLFPFFIINSIWAKTQVIPSESRLRQRFNPFWTSQVLSKPLIHGGIGKFYKLSSLLVKALVSNWRSLRIKLIGSNATMKQETEKGSQDIVYCSAENEKG